MSPIVERSHDGVWRRIAFAVFAGWGNRGVAVAVSLVQVPLLYAYLGDRVLGVWFLMLGAQNVSGLFDLGFGPTFQRQVAFAVASCGRARAAHAAPAGAEPVLSLLSMARVFYRLTAIAVFAALLVAGFAYSRTVGADLLRGIPDIGVSWVIVAFGFAAATWAWSADLALNGFGDIGWSNVVAAVVSLASLVATWMALQNGFGLVGVAAAWALKGVVTGAAERVLLIWLHPWARKHSAAWTWAELRAMTRPALELWMTAVANLMLVGVPRYVIGYFAGLEAVAPFEITRLVLTNVQACFASIATVSTPLLSAAWRTMGPAGMRRIAVPTINVALPLLVGTYALIAVTGDRLFGWWIGSDRFVGNLVLGILCIQTLLEAHHAMFQAPCVAAGALRFCRYQFLGGVLCVLVLPTAVDHFGVLGAALAVTVPRMLTDNWIIPALSARLMELPLADYLPTILAPALAAGVLLALLSLVLKVTVTNLLAWSACQAGLVLVSAATWWRFRGAMRAIVAPRADDSLEPAL